LGLLRLSGPRSADLVAGRLPTCGRSLYEGSARSTPSRVSGILNIWFRATSGGTARLPPPIARVSMGSDRHPRRIASRCSAPLSLRNPLKLHSSPVQGGGRPRLTQRRHEDLARDNHEEALAYVRAINRSGLVELEDDLAERARSSRAGTCAQALGFHPRG